MQKSATAVQEKDKDQEKEAAPEQIKGGDLQAQATVGIYYVKSRNKATSAEEERRLAMLLRERGFNARTTNTPFFNRIVRVAGASVDELKKFVDTDDFGIYTKVARTRGTYKDVDTAKIERI